MKSCRLEIALGCTLAILLTGCSDGIRQSIRAHDFRAQRSQRPAVAPPSPIANVADMPGWTTDLDGALAFARDNAHKTVVFVQQAGTPASQSMKSVLVSSQTNSALTNVEKVTFDAGSSPDMAARYGVPPPAVVVLDANGTAIAQQRGAVNRQALMAAVR